MDRSTHARVPAGARLVPWVAIASLVLIAASYVVNAMDRQVFPVVLPAISKEYGFSLPSGGLLSTIFTLGIGLAGVPSGYLLDRFSRKTVMLVGIGIYSVFTLLTALSQGFGDMFVYRAFSGVGEAMHNAAIFSAVGAYFFANRSLALGSLNFAYGLGGYIGPQLGAHLAGGGWRIPFYTYAGIGIFMAILIVLFIRASFSEQQEVPPDVSRAAALDHVPGRVLNRNIVLLAIAAAVIGLAMYGFIGLYPTFLQTHLHLTQAQAGVGASMFGLGALLGIPAGILGDRVDQRWLLIVAVVAGCFVGYFIFNGPTDAAGQYVLSFCEGAIASGFCFVNVYSAMQRAVRPEMVGRASGLFVASFYIPSAFAGYLFSALVGSVGWGGAGLVQLTLIPIIAVVVLLFVRPSRFSNARHLPAV